MSRYVIYFHPGDSIPDRMKYVDDATGAPDANDDAATLGVTVGSIWIDTATPAAYVCADASTGAAVWVAMAGGGGNGDLTSLLIDASVSGATTVDRADAATHDLTLTGNATLTPDNSDPTAGEAIDLRLLIRQDGTGGWTLDWGGTITWAGGSEPDMPTDPDSAITVGLLSVDDGVTWLGYFDQTGSAIADILAIPTVETDTDLRLAPDGAGGVEWAAGGSVTAAAVAAVGYWAPLVDSESGDLIRDEDTNEVIMAFIATP